MNDFSCYGGLSKAWLDVQATLPAPDKTLSVEQYRDANNANREKTSAAEFKAFASLVDTADHHIPTRDGTFVLEARTYRPRSLSPPNSADYSGASPVFLYFHGGGFVFGTLDSEDSTAAQIAVHAAVVVLNVNYRHTPEYTYPAAWLDAQDAFFWLHAHADALAIDPQRIIVGGISAGGHLAASLTLEHHLGHLDHLTAHKLPPLAGQILMIPSLVLGDCYGPQLARLAHPEFSSRVENAKAPILSAHSLDIFTDLLQIHDPDPADTQLNTGNATPEQVRGLPPAVFAVCSADPLRDEGLLYAQRLTEEGVPTDVHLFKGVPHAFSVVKTLALSQVWDRVMEQGIVWVLSQPTATRRFHIQVHEA